MVIGVGGFLLFLVVAISTLILMMPQGFEGEAPHNYTTGIVVVASLTAYALPLVATLISGYLWYRALYTLSTRSGEELFRWAGPSYLGYANL
jgi:uncharacterized membrane protein